MFIALIALIIALAVLRLDLPWDHQISDFFFKEGQWLWPKSDTALTFWLHDLLAYIFVSVGILCILLAILSFYIPRFKPYRFGAILLALSLLTIPPVIAKLKMHTNVFCPAKLARYQGAVPDNYRNISMSSDELLISRCFPAAHPSPGFALFALGVAATKRSNKIIGYALGSTIGTLLSIIQIGRGEHFLSHGLATAIVALWVVRALARLMRFSIRLFGTYMRDRCQRA